METEGLAELDLMVKAAAEACLESIVEIMVAVVVATLVVTHHAKMMVEQGGLGLTITTHPILLRFTKIVVSIPPVAAIPETATSP